MYDDSSIQNDLQDPQWADFEMPFVTRDAASWGIGVPKEEQDTAFGRFISGMAAEWHRNGRIVELEKKWNIKPSKWVGDMHKLYKEAGNHGRLLK
jgi:polar amino acid transport system substrate-binding protein